VIRTAERVRFLRKVHLFHGASDEDLSSLAGMFQERAAPVGWNIVEQGTPSSDMHLLCTGRARVVLSERGKERELATLVAGDFFGEEAFLTRRRRAASVVATEPSTVLTISSQSLKAVQKMKFQVSVRLEIVTASCRLARRLKPVAGGR
jgi:CPA1 family monovalent cation:H+ antiporter